MVVRSFGADPHPRSIEVAGKRFDCEDRAAKQRTFLARRIDGPQQLCDASGVEEAHRGERDRLQRACPAGGPDAGWTSRTWRASAGDDRRAHDDAHQPGASARRRGRAGDARQSGVSRRDHPGAGRALCLSVRQCRCLRTARGEASQRPRDFAARSRRAAAEFFPGISIISHELPREPLSRKDTPSSLRCKVDGFYRALHSRLGDPVARM